MSLGITGSHRCGKTTLAEAVSNETDLPLVLTSTSKVFRDEGLDPAMQLPFRDRLRIQNKVLDVCTDQWSKEKGMFVTDRTPICMMAYTLADVGMFTPIEHHSELVKYIDRCFEAVNAYFSMLVIVQPGIPLVFDPNKMTAVLNESYIEHLNTLIFGLVYDARCQTPAVYIRRDCTDLQERVKCVVYARQRSFAHALNNHGYESGKTMAH